MPTEPPAALDVAPDGAWIEMYHLSPRCTGSCDVAPDGAWIEIYSARNTALIRTDVAPDGAWIEISNPLGDSFAKEMSRLLARGLKFKRQHRAQAVSEYRTCWLPRLEFQRN